MNDNSSESLIKAYSIIEKRRYSALSETYCVRNNTEAFQKVLISYLSV